MVKLLNSVIKPSKTELNIVIPDLNRVKSKTAIVHKNVDGPLYRNNKHVSYAINIYL